MAFHSRRKTTTIAMRTLLILWLCGGFCLCVDEIPNFQDEDQQPQESNTPQTDNTDALSVGASTDEDDKWGDFAVTDEPSVAAPDDGESEAAIDQSEAPQDEDISSTETPSVDTEMATSVSSQKPKPETTDQPDLRGDFILRDDDNLICLRACFEASFMIDYVGVDKDSKPVNRTTEIPIPKKASVGGRCGRGDEQSVLTLEWDEGNCVLKITFQKKNATKKGDPNFWVARMIKLTFDTRDNSYFDSAINAGQRVVRTDPALTYFPTPMGDSRVCDSEDDINLMSASNNTETVTMEISELQMQPYGIVNGTFGEGADCGEDLIENPSTNVASIAVGATLACLILVVIIVYAVGRKMGAINDRSGYKSVE